MVKSTCFSPSGWSPAAHRPHMGECGAVTGKRGVALRRRCASKQLGTRRTLGSRRRGESKQHSGRQGHDRTHLRTRMQSDGRWRELVSFLPPKSVLRRRPDPKKRIDPDTDICPCQNNSGSSCEKQCSPRCHPQHQGAVRGRARPTSRDSTTTNTICCRSMMVLLLGAALLLASSSSSAATAGGGSEASRSRLIAWSHLP